MKIKTKVIVYELVIVMIFAVITISYDEFSITELNNTKYLEKTDETIIRYSGYWDLTGSPISIDDTNPTNNWAYTALNYDWCSGSGSWSDPYIIENVTIDGQNSASCITIIDSTQYFIIRNCTLLNAKRDWDQGGIKLERAENGLIINNTCTNCENGMYTNDNCANNTFVKNVLRGNDYYKMAFYGSSYSNVSENIFRNNGEYGIEMVVSDYNLIANNLIRNNGWWAQTGGMSLEYCVGNVISKNEIIDNENRGIFLDDYSDYNDFVENYISNQASGIYISYYSINDNNFYGNTIENNGKGVYIDNSIPGDNTFYLNYFLGNGNHYVDDSINDMYLDNGAIGNYWDDYTGRDENDDGIGDTPHIIECTYVTRQDNFPIWREPPQITINTPLQNELYGEDAPSFNIHVIESNLEHIWYSLDGGMTNYYIVDNGTIDQSLWINKPDGLINISFYADDILGNINSSSVIVIKDTVAPSISINSPQPSDIFSYYAPLFNVEISDVTLESEWYTINNDLAKYFFTHNESIDANLWDSLLDGQVKITFYANDSLGQLASKYVNIYKDTKNPSISIISPTVEQEFGSNAPAFIVEVNEANIKRLGYKIEGIEIEYNFTTNSTINQAAWEGLPNGEVYLSFFIEDIAGKEDWGYIMIIKNVLEQPEELEPDIFPIFIGVIGGVSLGAVAITFLVIKRIKRK